MHRTAEFFGRSISTHRIGAFAISITDYLAGTTIAWHDHTGPYLTYVARGGYRERLPKSTRDCARHHLVPHPSGEVHADEFRMATRCINIQPDPAWLVRCRVSFDDCRAVESGVSSSIMSRLVLELRRNDTLSLMVIEALLLELLAAFMRAQHPLPAPTWLQNIHDEILSSFREPLTLSDFASAANVHPVHVARSFRRHFGSTVGEFIRERRVEFAKNRIRAGCALSEVALEAGFADHSHLTRTFRSLTGVTPSEFRRSQSVPGR